ncbi:MAG TPA: hypothetical protein VF857_02995 [Spirochaetota bacterium]
MKISVELTMDIRDNNLAESVARLSGAGCVISRIVALSRDLQITRYQIDIIYDDPSAFKRCIASFDDESGRYTVIHLKNYLDELLSHGFLHVRGSMRIDTPEDYEMNVLGARQIAHEKILESDNPLSFTGIKRNVGCITGVKGKNEQAKTVNASHYIESEIASVMLSKLAGMNGFPFHLRFDMPEDFLKMIASIESGFSAMRISHLDDDDNSEVFDQLPDALSIPFVSRTHDELTIFALAAILKMAKKHRCKIKESNIGFIGLNAASIRLAQLCLRMGCMRVLGFDNNEKCMLTFERQKGLATTPENILVNSDIVILMRNHFTEIDLTKMRPGIIVISFLDDPTSIKSFEEKRSCREIISGEWADSAILYPGIIKGLLSSGKKHLSIDDITALSETLAEAEAQTGKIFPGLFSDIHDKIQKTVCAER